MAPAQLRQKEALEAQSKLEFIKRFLVLRHIAKRTKKSRLNSAGARKLILKKSESKSLPAFRDDFDEKLRGYSTLSTAALATAGAFAMGTVSATAGIVDLTFGAEPPSVTSNPGLGATVGFSVKHQTFSLGNGAILYAEQFGQPRGQGSQSKGAGGAVEIASFNSGAKFATSPHGSIKNFAAGSANHISHNQFTESGRFFGTHSTNTRSYKIGKNPIGNFQPSGTGPLHRATGYLGFELHKNGKTYYGWLHITVGEGANGRPNYLAVTPGPNSGVEGAFNNTPDGAIYAGEVSAIPEPASLPTGLALFALGAAGVREMRRRRENRPTVAG